MSDGIKIEALALDPSVLAHGVDRLGTRLAEEMARLSRWATWAAPIRAQTLGTVTPGRKGPRVRFDLVADDVHRIRRAIAALGEVMFAAGAVEVAPGVAGYRPARHRRRIDASDRADRPEGPACLHTGDLTCLRYLPDGQRPQHERCTTRLSPPRGQPSVCRRRQRVPHQSRGEPSDLNHVHGLPLRRIHHLTWRAPGRLPTPRPRRANAPATQCSAPRLTSTQRSWCSHSTSDLARCSWMSRTQPRPLRLQTRRL